MCVDKKDFSSQPSNVQKQINNSYFLHSIKLLFKVERNYNKANNKQSKILQTSIKQILFWKLNGFEFLYLYNIYSNVHRNSTHLFEKNKITIIFKIVQQS